MTAISRRSLRSSTSTLGTIGYPFDLHNLQGIPPNLLDEFQLGMPATKGKGGGKKAKQTLLDDFHDNARPTTKVNGKNGTRGSKKSKRKASDYEEDDGGFQFSRAAPKKKSRPSLDHQQPSEDSIPSHDGDDNDGSSAGQMVPPPKKPAKKVTKKAATSGSRKKANAPPANNITAELPERPVNGRTSRGQSRRQQSDSSEQHYEQPEPTMKPPQEQPVTSRTTRSRKRTASPSQPPPPSRIPQPPSISKTRHADSSARQHTPIQTMANVTIEPTPQKIALPFADTPVMRKNKEMRMKNSKKAGGQRRSSLGMRGRRASSLIDSGASNALPHDEVRTEEFFKHIEGEGLPEPRRMRQLLTWCATRAIAQKPVARSSEDQSAILAARIIQDEILKEFCIRSELSDWFSREDTDPSPAVVRKPNPKNEQNSEKIRELEAQIDRLRKEKETLRSLMHPPSIPEIKYESSDEDESISTITPSISKINRSLLGPTQQQLLESLSLRPSTKPPDTTSQSEILQPSASSDSQLDTSIDAITTRLSRLTTSLLPTIDTFAAGIHNIELYRSVADDTAGNILKLCARRLEARDRARRAAARRKDKGDEGEDDEQIDDDDDEVRRDDLAAVLGALSRVEQ